MNKGLKTIDGISFKHCKSIVPKTEPCYAPLVTGMEKDVWPLSTNCCSLFDKMLSILYYEVTIQ